MMLDVDYYQRSLSAYMGLYQARAFLMEVERITGKRPLLFTSSKFISERFTDKSVASGLLDYLTGVPLWLSDTSAGIEDPSMPSDSPWTKWTLWRYQDGFFVSASNTPSAESKKLNLGEPSIFNGDHAALDEFVRTHAWDFTIVHEIDSETGDIDLLAHPTPAKPDAETSATPEPTAGATNTESPSH
jgi:hypothetical protein